MIDARILRSAEETQEVRLSGPEAGPVVEARVRLPVCHKGYGLRALADIVWGAYLGGLEQAIPHFAMAGPRRGDPLEGLLPSLAAVVGSDFLKPGQTNRWDTLLNSGERTGAELRHAYNQIQQEIVATRAIVPIADQHDFVPHEPDDPSLNPMADFAGECKGHIQKYLLHEVERHRNGRWRWEVEHPGQGIGGNLRQLEALKFCQTGTSSAWHTALPTAYEKLSNPQMAECAATFMGIPSPACAPQVGHRVAGKVYGRHRRNAGQPIVVDAYGDVFASEPVGPGFTKRHDALKHTLQNVLDWAKIRHVLEVYNLFAALIPQQGLARLESDSKKQGLVPDFHIIAGQGLTMEGLAELKFIGRCPSHYMYPGAPGDNPTAAKAHTFQALYEKKAADVDHADGRVLQRLRSFGRVKGLVAGAYTELSPDFQILVKEIAEHVIGGPLGAEANLRTGANALGRIRRRLGVSAARSHADLVLAGLQFCGPGGAEAYARRNRTGGRNHCMHQSMMAERNSALDYGRMGRALFSR